MERDDINKFLKGVSGAAFALHEQADRVKKAIAPYEAQLRAANEVVGRVTVSIAEVAHQVAPYLVELHRALDELPERTRRELELLAEHGWYIDPDMPCTASTEYARLFMNGMDEEANNLLQAYYDEHAQNVLYRLCERFPERTEILRAAFSAHHNKEFSLSVPVFLAQADGICKSLLGVQLYGKTKNGKSTKVRDAVEKFEEDPFMESLLAPFLKPFAINSGPNQRSEGDLNRHAVLHGESVSYGTLRNSCKAMSLIAFTEWALSERFDVKG